MCTTVKVVRVHLVLEHGNYKLPLTLSKAVQFPTAEIVLEFFKKKIYIYCFYNTREEEHLFPNQFVRKSWWRAIISTF